ncbi:hypothetical protein [Lentilactobacillus senioris]|uniref:hypothetical protein n=1 Tax=Lentilactobacillus senioris TaxID=931534 RepID=UPI0006D14C20|nr:hypothetical protein [Lentilactobacillus senioris]
MVHFFDRQSNQRAQFYGRLIDNLRIQPDDLILFGNLSDFEEQEKREAVQANAEESVNEVQEQDEPTESKVTINSSTEPIEKNRMVEDEEVLKTSILLTRNRIHQMGQSKMTRILNRKFKNKMIWKNYQQVV